MASPEAAHNQLNGSSDSFSSDNENDSDILLGDYQLPEHFARLSKLRHEGVFCDLQVSVSGRDFMTHRCILGAASPHFLRLLLGEPNCCHFSMPRGCSPDAFALVLEFCYTGRLRVPDRLLPQVCSLASLMGVRPVMEACASRLLRACLLPRTALELRAQLSDCPPLLESIDSFITANLAEVLSHDVACLPKVMVDLLVSGCCPNGLNQLCDLLADWLARSVHDSSTSSSPSPGCSLDVASSVGDTGDSGGVGSRSGSGNSVSNSTVVDLDCLERMASQAHLLYLAPNGVLVDCDDLAAVANGGNGPENELANSVPQIRDYIDSKRLHARIMSSRHRGPSPLARSVLGVLTPSTPQSNAADSVSSDEAGQQEAGPAPADRAVAQCLARIGSALALLSVRLLPLVPPEDTAAVGAANLTGFQRQLSVQSGGGGGASGGFLRQVSTQSGELVSNDAVNDFGGNSSPTRTSSVASDSALVFPPMSTPRSAFGFVNFGGGSVDADSFCLLACGGYNRGQCLSSAEILRPGFGGWTPAPPLLTARSRCSAAVLNGDRVYLCGGSNGASELSTVEVFDGHQWLPGPPMQLARSGCCSVAMDGLVYCLGGRNGADSLRQAEMLDPRLGRWQPLPPMLAWRNECTGAAYAERLWAAGGADKWGGQCLASVEAFDPRAARWIPAARQLGHARRGAAMAELAGRLWLVGGSDGQRPALAACEPLPATPIMIDNDDDCGYGLGAAESGVEATTPTLQLASPRANLGLAALPPLTSFGTAAASPCLLAVGGFSGKVFLDCCELLHL